MCELRPSLLTRLLLLGLLSTLSACQLQQLSKADAQPKRDMNQVLDEARQAYQAEDWQTSKKNYLLVVQVAPGDIEAWFRLGNIYTRTHQPELAAKAYQECLVRDPENTKAWHNMGVIYLRQAQNSFRQQRLYARPDDTIVEQDKHILEKLNTLVIQK